MEQWLQEEEEVYMKVTVNNIAHVFSSPEAYSDTNKSFKMLHPLVRTVHQTALTVWMMQGSFSSLPTPSEEEEERVGDFSLVSLINVDANLLSEEVLCVLYCKCFVSWLTCTYRIYILLLSLFYLILSLNYTSE